jgi:hypothetical protein
MYDTILTADIYVVIRNYMNLVSVFGIETGYELDDPGVGVLVPVGSRISLFSTSCRPALGSTRHPTQWVPVNVSPGLKRPKRESDQSPPTSAEVKNTWMYMHSPIRLNGVVLN